MTLSKSGPEVVLLEIVENVLSPEGTLREAKPVWGPFNILSILLWSREGCLTLSIYKQKFAFLKS